jgi:acetyltransferase-like isoleucine patch superfamily enzyme
MNSLLTKLYYIKYFFRFKSYGENLIFSRGGKIFRPNEITFGSNIAIGHSFHISARNLSFGSNIGIGPGVIIECDNHIYDKIGSSMFKNFKNRRIGFVNIEDDVWIGAKVVILPNVIIGEGCIVGAGSVVTKSLPPYSICVGNPCKAIKPRFSEEELKEHLFIVKSIKKSSEIISLLRKINIYK